MFTRKAAVARNCFALEVVHHNIGKGSITAVTAGGVNGGIASPMLEHFERDELKMIVHQSSETQTRTLSSRPKIVAGLLGCFPA